MSENQDPVGPEEYLRRLQSESAGSQHPVYTQQPTYRPPAYPQMPPLDHPSATTAMVLGIIALGSIGVACGIGLVVSPFAWAIGSKALKEIDADPGRFGGRDRANAGKIMGIIGSVLLIVALVSAVAVFALAFASSDTPSRGTYDTTFESDF